MPCESCNPNIVYVTVPEYQPSSASVTIGGDPFYGASNRDQNISVRRTGLNTNTILMVAGAVAVGLGILFFAWKRK